MRALARPLASAAGRAEEPFTRCEIVLDRLIFSGRHLPSEGIQVQRLKQHNLGMQLRLAGDEFLVADGPVFPYCRYLQRVRMRIELGGYAERSFHEIAPQHSVFNHCSTQVDRTQLTVLASALQAVRAAIKSNLGEDPSAEYRRLEFWDRGESVRVCVRFVGGHATPDAPAFEAAWEILERQFVVEQNGKE